MRWSHSCGGTDGMTLINTSPMNRVTDGSVEPLDAYMKGANKAAIAHFPKPVDLEGGH
jgi:twitching motility protein PilT